MTLGESLVTDFLLGLKVRDVFSTVLPFRLTSNMFLLIQVSSMKKWRPGLLLSKRKLMS